MAQRTIYVSRLNSNSTQIKLRDSEGHNPGNDQLTTLVDTNDTVVWELDNNSGLTALTLVKKKSNSPHDLLSIHPKQNSDGKWSATVKSTSPGIGKRETYKIKYTIGDEEYKDDPVLQMNN